MTPDNDNRPEMPRMLTAAEVAPLLRRNKPTIARWAKAGKLPGLVRTPSGGMLFREDDIRAYLLGGQS